MKKVLIIDDDAAFRSMLEWTLLKYGYRVIEASNGKSGLELFHTQAPDVVVVDIFMPVKDGLEVIMELHEIGHASKVIAITGMESNYQGNVLAMAEKFSAAYTFTKPFELEAFCVAVRSIACQGDSGKEMCAMN